LKEFSGMALGNSVEQAINAGAAENPDDILSRFSIRDIFNEFIFLEIIFPPHPFPHCAGPGVISG